MMKKIKKPVSIILAVMMVVSLFAVVPVTASAAEERTFTETTTLNATNVGTEVWQINEDVTVTINGGLTITGELTVQGKGTLVVNGRDGGNGAGGSGGDRADGPGEPGGYGYSGRDGGTGGNAVNGAGTLKVDGVVVRATGGNGGTGGTGGNGANGGDGTQGVDNGGKGGTGGTGGTGGDGGYAFVCNVIINSGEVYGTGGDGGNGGGGGAGGQGGARGWNDDDPFMGRQYGSPGANGNPGTPGNPGGEGMAFASAPVVDVAHTIEGGSTQQNIVAVQDPTAYRYVIVTVTASEPADPAADVTALIDALPAEITLDNAADVQAARQAYDALSDADKQKIDAATLTKLTDAEAKIADLTAVKAVTDAINALPDTDSLTLDNSQAVADAVAAYSALTDAQRDMMDGNTEVKLYQAIAKLNNLAAAKAVENAITALPSAADATLENKEAIEAARAAYDALTDADKQKIDADTLTKLTDNERKIENLEAVKGVADAINALPAVSDLTLDNAKAVSDARAAYNALTGAQKYMFGVFEAAALTKLTDAEAKIADLTAAKAVTDAIDAIPAEVNPTDHKQQVEAARAAYDALTEDQQALIDATKLEAAEKSIADQEAAAPIAEAINNLPENITLNDAADVRAAKDAYDALTDDQKALIDADTLAKLEAAVKTVEDMEAAAAVVEQIKALPAVADITADDKDAIYSAKEAYDALTDDQKALIPVLDKAMLDAAVIVVDAAVKAAEDEAAAAAVAEMIAALPAVADVTIDNKDDINAAKAAYDALTDDQKRLISPIDRVKLAAVVGTLAGIEDEIAADAVEEMIAALPAVADVTIDNKDDINAAKAAYDALTDDQKKLVALTDRAKLAAVVGTLAGIEDEIAASAVEELIRALSAADAITLDDKAAVEEASAAFNALTDDQKKLVNLTDRITLAQDQAAIEKLENDKAAAEAVAEQINALPASEAVTYEDKDSIEAARAAYDALTDEQKALIDDDTYFKLADDEFALSEILEVVNVEDMINALPAPEDVTINDKEAIEAARDAYEALFDDQKAQIDEETTNKLAAAEEALAQVEADIAAAQAVTDEINALPSALNVTLDDKDAIENAAAAYDALTDAQKAYVPLTARLKLVADKGALDAAEKIAEDTAAADAVEDIIRALPAAEELTLDDKAAVDAAAAAFDALTNAQKRMVNLTDRITLAQDQAAIQKLENDKAAADAVTEQINALPAAEDVTLDDKDSIEAARAAYDALTDEQKAQVDEDAANKLADDEAALAELLEAANVADMINALPAAEDVTIDDKDAIEAARDAYDALTDEQKAQIDEETTNKLTAAEEALDQVEADIAAAQAVTDEINALPSALNVTLDDKDAIENAAAAYDALTDAQKAYVPLTARLKLVADKGALDAAEKIAEDTAAADAVEDIIRALPAADELTLDDKAAVEEARAAYDALTPDQKKLVNLTDKIQLVLDEAAIEKLENDKAAADAVTEQINALPAAEDVTLDDKDSIEAARAAYDALTDDQKALVDEETYNNLKAAEEALAKEEADTAAAQAVTDRINALPAAEDVTAEDKDAIEAARDAYDALTDDQKAKISDSTYQKLTDAEEALNNPVILGDVDGDGKVTITDVTFIQMYLAGMDYPETLTEATGDVDGNGRIDVTDATLIQMYLAKYENVYNIGEPVNG